MSKTVSSRLQDGKHEMLREKCNQLGCTINDFIKDAVEMKLNGSNSFENCTDCDELVHECVRTIIDNVHGSDYTLTTSEKTGKPIVAELRWYENDDERYFEKEWQKRQKSVELKEPKVVEI